jgi:hypothetical protein
MVSIENAECFYVLVKQETEKTEKEKSGYFQYFSGKSTQTNIFTG